MPPNGAPPKGNPIKGSAKPKPKGKETSGGAPSVQNSGWSFRDDGPDETVFWGSEWNSRVRWPMLPTTTVSNSQAPSIKQPSTAASNSKGNTPGAAQIIEPEPTKPNSITPNNSRITSAQKNKSSPGKSDGRKTSAQNLKPTVTSTGIDIMNADSFDMDDPDSIETYYDPRPIEEREGPIVLTSNYREPSTDRIEDLLVAQKIPRPAFYIIEIPRTKEDELKPPSVQKFEQLRLIQSLQKQAYEYTLQHMDLLTNAVVIDERHAKGFGMFKSEYEEVRAITWEEMEKKTLEEGKDTVKRIQTLLLNIGGEIHRLEYIVMEDDFLVNESMARMLAQSREELRKTSKQGDS